MPRIAGVDIPEKKKILYALQYIHGIGAKFAADILQQTGIEPDTLASQLDDQQLSSIAQIIDASYLVEGALRRQVQQNIQRLRDIRSYRGDRHRKGLPVRGQRTRCNARTRKGRKKTVAGKKGVKG
jgi:small subunit ribosomal protein S13